LQVFVFVLLSQQNIVSITVLIATVGDGDVKTWQVCSSNTDVKYVLVEYLGLVMSIF